MTTTEHHYRQMFVSGFISFTLAFALAGAAFSRAQTPVTASLYMSADKTQIAPNSQVSVGVGLSSGAAKVTGIDAVIYFNSNVLDVAGASLGSSSLKTLVPGASNTLDLTKAVSINQASPSQSTVSLGLVSFDQVNNQLTASVSGTYAADTNPLVTLKFRAKSPGQSNISFKYQAGDTTDSNIVSLDSGEPTDIMAAPNSSVTITVVNPSPTPAPLASTTPTPSPRASTSPSASPAACSVYDLNHDGKVDVVDITLVANRWGSVTGDPNYSSLYDLNHDGAINIVDIQLEANHWGGSCI